MINILKKSKVQIAVFIFTLILVIGVFGRNLNPFDSVFFTGHDETQAARISEFTYNLKEGQIPPRIAPHFSYGLGYPVFNYYAPFSYWVTSGLNYIGFDTIAALEIGYLFALLIGCIGMYLLLRSYFSFYAALAGTLAYLSSPYVAVDIFVRGNLGEMWVFAILPLALYLLKTNTKKRFILTALAVAALFSSHNILSPISIGVVTFFILFNNTKLLNFAVIGSALLIDAYFLIPAIFELGMVNATSVAVGTNFTDHFLCLSQLWSSFWGFAGSAPGCSADGMSFMLGKIQILISLFGVLLFGYRYFKKHTYDIKTPLFFLILVLGSIFMTTSFSQVLWQISKPITSLFQFPWRFLMIAVFGMAFFTGYAVEYFPKKWGIYFSILVILALIVMNHKFFYGQNISLSEFRIKYLSDDYLKNTVAYRVAEYLPVSVDYKTWRTLEKNNQKLKVERPIVAMKNQNVLLLQDSPFQKILMVKSKTPLLANIHYAPYWSITVNQEPFIPHKFDALGRPFITVSSEAYDGVVIKYTQTRIELIGNWITMLSLLSTIGSLAFIYRPSWKIVTVKKI